jgi:GNAT superfamily N-acetyltransferase|uniref:Acetyltransferase domain containing protein n=1 Tax=Caudovirales sp. ctTqA28 TaxID=2826775 RepID=A0A8S5MD36_9CAUD|nr:MAG TPA: acetyltransferase domain containing protein [Caudovirales sp. ctTqA28]
MRQAPQVRDAGHLDLLMLAKLAEEYAQEVIEMKQHPVDARVLMQGLAATISNPTGYLKVLSVDGKIVGGFWGCLTNMPWSSTLIAQDIIVFVNKEYRGYGKLLIEDWLKWSESMGAKEVCLSTGSGIKTEVTCKLFERYGFRKVGYMYMKEIL